MSDIGIEFSGPRKPGHHRTEKKKGRFTPLIVVLLVFALLAAGLYWAVNQVSGVFGAEAEDYEGQGEGSAEIVIAEGDTARDIATTLNDADVVASVDAFISAADAEPAMSSIQPGTCAMRQQMSSEAAVSLLLEPETCSPGVPIVIPEGWRVDQIVDRIVENTHISEDELETALDDPEAIGLPESAEGDAEGYLFPARYVVTADMTAEHVLRQMTQAMNERITSLNLSEQAADLGYEEHELITVASIVQREVREDDMPQAAQVIYNRLDDGMMLQMDSTVHFAGNLEGSVWTTTEDRDIDSPYNTYRETGLPPGPIGAPGDAALEAAADPASGEWMFFVTVDLESGETKFAETESGHSDNVEELRAWCRETDTDLCS